LSRTPPLLQIKELLLHLLGPVSLSLCAGECLCITGPSGSGKTLLLRALADLDPHEGEVWLQDVPAHAISPPQWRKQVGLLPPESGWWLRTARAHFPAEQSIAPARLGLDEELLDHPVGRLSSGERQRLALLRLLANQPHVLLLDEPTANLDADNTLRVERVVAEYRRQRPAAVIWVSHDPAQVTRVATRAACLVDGLLKEE
jgi:UDP-glucose/iron transport system ATP-binding protein